MLHPRPLQDQRDTPTPAHTTPPATAVPARVADPPDSLGKVRKSSASRAAQKNTPGSPFQSTCPAIIAGPSSLGVGAPVYQPAGYAPGGTSIDPSACNPRSMISKVTPSNGISMIIGSDADIGAAADPSDDGDRFSDPNPRVGDELISVSCG